MGQRDMALMEIEKLRFRMSVGMESWLADGCEHSSLARLLVVAGDLVHPLKVRDPSSHFLSGVSITPLDMKLFDQRIQPTSNSPP